MSSEIAAEVLNKKHKNKEIINKNKKIMRPGAAAEKTDTSEPIRIDE